MDASPPPMSCSPRAGRGGCVGAGRAGNLGLVSGPDGALRLFAGRVRIPDVAFVSWGRLPGRRRPPQPLPDLVPDLAAEVLSAGNTAAEMARKLQEYFTAGVRLVWVIDPPKKTARVYRTPEEFQRVAADGTLDGEEVLPGFRVSLTELFGRADEGPPDS